MDSHLCGAAAAGLETLDSAQAILDSSEPDVPNNTQIIANLEAAAEEAGLPVPKHNSKDHCLLVAFLSGEPTILWKNNAREKEMVEPPAIDPRLDPASPWHPIYKYMIEQQRLWEELKHDWPGK